MEANDDCNAWEESQMSIQCDTEGASGQRKSHGFHRLRNDMVVVSEVFR